MKIDQDEMHPFDAKQRCHRSSFCLKHSQKLVANFDAAAAAFKLSQSPSRIPQNLGPLRSWRQNRPERTFADSPYAQTASRKSTSSFSVSSVWEACCRRYSMLQPRHRQSSVDKVLACEKQRALRASLLARQALFTLHRSILINRSAAI